MTKRMSLRSFPVFSTIIVLVSVAIMIWLGFWQIERMGEEEAKVTRYEAAIANPQLVDYPGGTDMANERLHYRRSQIDCLPEGDWRLTAGRSAKGQTGYAHVIPCTIGQGRTASLQAGWSRDLTSPAWDGGIVKGIIIPNRDGSFKLMADPPVAGLGASEAPKMPDPKKNLAYAGQWFFFALTALIIFFLAVRRMKSDAPT